MELVHGVQDAAMDWFKTVAEIGESAAKDDGHGVLGVGSGHFVVDVDWNDGPGGGWGGPSGRGSAGCCHPDWRDMGVGVSG